MGLLIDGYNLLHVTDLFGSGKTAGTLQGSRDALLAYLAKSLSARERSETTIVFDAAGAPPGLPKVVQHEQMTARYASDFADADALLEEIIDQHRAPKGLTVVSSDHRVQRAARRRGAKYVDSESWFRELCSRAKNNERNSPQGKPTASGSVDYWVEQFDTEEISELEQQLRATEVPKIIPKTTKRTRHAPPVAEGGFDNPFPPGYGEDLLEEEG